MIADELASMVKVKRPLFMPTPMVALSMCMYVRLVVSLSLFRVRYQSQNILTLLRRWVVFVGPA